MGLIAGLVIHNIGRPEFEVELRVADPTMGMIFKN